MGKCSKGRREMIRYKRQETGDRRQGQETGDRRRERVTLFVQIFNLYNGQCTILSVSPTASCSKLSTLIPQFLFRPGNYQHSNIKRTQPICKTSSELLTVYYSALQLARSFQKLRSQEGHAKHSHRYTLLNNTHRKQYTKKLNFSFIYKFKNLKESEF